MPPFEAVADDEIGAVTRRRATNRLEMREIVAAVGVAHDHERAARGARCRRSALRRSRAPGTCTTRAPRASRDRRPSRRCCRCRRRRFRRRSARGARNRLRGVDAVGRRVSASSRHGIRIVSSRRAGGLIGHRLFRREAAVCGARRRLPQAWSPRERACASRSSRKAADRRFRRRCCSAVLVSLARGVDTNLDLRNYHFYNPWAWLQGPHVASTSSGAGPVVLQPAARRSVSTRWSRAGCRRSRSRS